MKPITAFELLNHGIEHSQYFQGCGICFTEFTDVATGCGSNLREAIDDALESLAQNDWDTEGMEKRILKEYGRGRRTIPVRPCVTSKMHDEMYYYASIRVS